MMAEARYSDLGSKRALVTGGADGIGKAVVQALADQGAAVAILDIAGKKGADLAASLRTAGRDVSFAQLDLRDIPAMQAAIAGEIAAGGAFDILVNNAGHDERHTFAELTEGYWDDRFAVNLRHMAFAAQAVATGMQGHGGGSIVNLGSTSWMQGAPGLIAYTTAKSAVLGFTRSLARELGPDGIRVNCVTPGWVMTERQRTTWATPDKIAQAQERQAIKGEIRPEDIAAVVLFLASDCARMCTGQNFIVDAGVV